MDKTRNADNPSSLDGVDLEGVRRQLSAALGRSCPPHLRDQREDLIQTAMLRLVSVLRSRPERVGVNATYIWKTAYCAMIDEIRRAHRRHEVPMSEEREPDGRPGPGDPEHDYRLGRLGDEVRDCLSRIVPPRRRAVTLHFLGYTPRETAARLGWTPKRVSNLVFRGLADLRRCLEQKGVTP